MATTTTLEVTTTQLRLLLTASTVDDNLRDKRNDLLALEETCRQARLILAQNNAGMLTNVIHYNLYQLLVPSHY